jgi:hypothetical protein
MEGVFLNVCVNHKHQKFRNGGGINCQKQLLAFLIEDVSLISHGAVFLFILYENYLVKNGL